MYRTGGTPERLTTRDKTSYDRPDERRLGSSDPTTLPHRCKKRAPGDRKEPVRTGTSLLAMVEQHELRELEARLGPHLEQLTVRSGAPPQMLVHWGCGCTAIGAPSPRRDRAGVRWTRCAHHAEAAVP